MTKEKLRIYFKDGNNRTFTGSYKNEDRSLEVLKKLVTNKFQGLYVTALIYNRNDELAHKFVNDKILY